MSKDSTQGIPESSNLPALLTGVVDAEKILEMLKNLPAAQRHQMLVAITAYTGATTEKIDNYLGQRLVCKGLVLQQATVKIRDGQKMRVDPETGDPIEYTEGERIIMKADAPDGREHIFSFVSMAVANFSKQFLIPFCGMGDWKTEDFLPLVIKQKTDGDKRTYNCQIVN